MSLIRAYLAYLAVFGLVLVGVLASTWSKPAPARAKSTFIIRFVDGSGEEVQADSCGSDAGFFSSATLWQCYNGHDRTHSYPLSQIRSVERVEP